MRILIADDDIVSARLLHRTLERWGYEPVVVHDGLSALDVLTSASPPLMAVIDWMMPGMDGLEVVRRMREAGREPYTFTILLTSRSERTDLIAGLEAGADDYLAKPFDMHEMEVRLRGGRRIIELQGALIAAREALRIQATCDPLTGLYNRRALLDRLNMELVRCSRERLDLGFLMIDLDRFKQINDEHGHPAGDAVLIAAADRLRSEFRPYDVVGRIGGEEFVAILPGISPSSVVAAAERLRLAVAGISVDYGGQEIRVTCSIGVASLSLCNESTGEGLIREADLALYRSKADGRNRVSTAWRPPAEDGKVRLCQ